MLKRLRIAEIIFALVLFVFASGFPGIDNLSETNLAFHMTVQHLLVILAGFILGAQLVKLALPNKSLSVAFAVVAVALIGIWHIPKAFGAADSNELIHVLMHISFFVAGALIYAGLPSLGSALKWTLLVLLLIFTSILAANALGGIRGRQIYQSYSASQHTELAIVMVVTMPVVFLLIALSPLYVPKLGSFWTNNRLSIYVSGFLIVGLILGIFLMG